MEEEWKGVGAGGVSERQVEREDRSVLSRDTCT